MLIKQNMNGFIHHALVYGRVAMAAEMNVWAVCSLVLVASYS